METTTAPRPLVPEDAGVNISLPEQQEVIDDAFARFDTWRSQDHVALYQGKLADRQQAADRSFEDALLCERAAEIAASEGQRKSLLDAAHELRLNYLFLAPEDVTDYKMDLAVQLSVDIMEAKQEEWSPNDFSKQVQQFDLQHLVAFWEAKRAESDNQPYRREIAKAILGGTIADSADELERMEAHIMQLRETNDANKRNRSADLNGQMTEFFLLTAMRLNTLFEGSLDQLFLRSALDIEDSKNTAPVAISADLLSHHPEQESAHFIQVKSGKSDRKYDITEVHVAAKRFRREPEMALFLLREFVEGASPMVRKELIGDLNQIIGLGESIRGKAPNPTLEELTTPQTRE
ncbi:MAG TPA: hypothetical protein VLF60_01085 [Candidatus Saccharimonadales bacterium]|nr:hypothetical protein [Candidatus Saccharimonadales bacterium]